MLFADTDNFFSSDNINYVDESLKNKKKKHKRSFTSFSLCLRFSKCTRKIDDNLLFHVGSVLVRLDHIYDAYVDLSWAFKVDIKILSNKIVTLRSKENYII